MLKRTTRWFGAWGSPHLSDESLIELHALLLSGERGVAARYQADDATPLIGRACREAEAFATGLRAAPATAQAQLEVRAFSTTGVEDPVTGSLNGSLADWLIAQGHLQAPYMANQGACVGRDGWVSVQQDAQQQLWIGGQTVTCVQGTVLL